MEKKVQEKKFKIEISQKSKRDKKLWKKKMYLNKKRIKRRW